MTHPEELKPCSVDHNQMIRSTLYGATVKCFRCKKVFDLKTSQPEKENKDG